MVSSGYHRTRDLSNTYNGVKLLERGKTDSFLKQREIWDLPVPIKIIQSGASFTL